MMTSFVVQILLFMFMATKVNCQCSGTPLTVTANSNTFQVITSPNYPSNYDNSANCEYLIDTGNANDHVVISYIAFNLETNFDKLKIYDGLNSASGTLLNTDTGQKTDQYYESSGQYMYLLFSSDYSVAWSGFKIQYMSVLVGMNKISCGAGITVDSSTSNQQYALPTFSAALSSTALCEWPISASGISYTVKIVYTDFNDFSTYTCDSTTEYGLAVYEGNNQLHRICSYLPDDIITLYATGDGSIKFRAPILNGVDRGFIVVINYESTAVSPVIPTLPPVVSSCGSESNPTHLLASNTTLQYITSPGYPAQYGNNLECWWVVTSSSEVSISPAAMTLDTSDTVTVYDGPSSSYLELASYSGSPASLTTIVSTGSSVTIRFKTDGSVTDIGFSIVYMETNGSIPSCASGYQVITMNNTGTFYLDSHSNYGSSNYDNDLDSYWVIDKGSESTTLYAVVQAFDIETSTRCIYDYVKVYQGACPVAENQILFECGELQGKEYKYTYGRYMLIHFHTDGSVTYDGWRVAYSLTDIRSNDEKEEEEKNWIIGAVIGGIVFFVIICSCKKGQRGRSQSKTAPYKKPDNKVPQEKKPIPSHIVLTPTPPKIKPEVVIDTWKRQQVRERMRRAIEKNREKKDDFDSILSSDDATENTDPPSNLEKVVIHKHPVTPPPTYEQSIQKDDVIHVEPSNKAPQLDAEDYLKIDPDHIPSAFEYKMPPQLQNR